MNHELPYLDHKYTMYVSLTVYGAMSSSTRLQRASCDMKKYCCFPSRTIFKIHPFKDLGPILLMLHPYIPFLCNLFSLCSQAKVYELAFMIV